MSADPLPAVAEPSVRAANAAAPFSRDRVGIGASAGGLPALTLLVAALPPDLPAALFVVVHISPHAQSALPSILMRAGPLPAVLAEDGMPVESGRIHVAPPDQHLLVEGEVLRVVRGPRENRHRPAIDPMLRSLGWSCGPRAVGVVMSGALDDGTAGLWALKSCGGTTVVQEPAEAQNPEMPNHALQHNRIDHRLPAAEIGQLLARLAQEPWLAKATPPPPGLDVELKAAALGGNGVEVTSRLGNISPFTCPTCHGTLWELDEDSRLRYRCHTGHAFSTQSLLADQAASAEAGLFEALRAVEEKAAVLRRLGERDGMAALREDYQRRAAELDRSAQRLREMLANAAL